MAETRSAGDVKAAFGLALLLIVTAALIDDGSFAWVLSPFILALVIYAAARAPLRDSLVTLAFCAFTLDYPTEPFAEGMVKSPLFNVGFAMLAHLNNLTGIRALSFSGTDIVLGVLIMVALSRERSGSWTDRAGRVPTPAPLVKLAKISLAATAFVWCTGLMRGGDFGKSLWQVEKVFYLPVLFLLYHLALRGPQDHVLLAKVVLLAAMVRATIAIYIAQTVVMPVDPGTGLPGVLPYATSHSDSMLFATAFVLLVLLVIEGAVPKARRMAFLLLPILVLGMISNNRRLVWVQVGIVLLTLYLVAPDNAIKRSIRRSAYTILPFLAAYVAAGWNAGSPMFKPVRIMRSVIEPATDGSSMWRELENYNLVYTIKDSPIFGQGYGNKWLEALSLPAVEYDLEYYLPHNSLLGLWASSGYLGYTAITLLWGASVYFAMRAYHAALNPQDRVAAILGVGAVLVYLVQCFGDLGLGSWTGVHILAPSMAVAGKLAVATGAWGAEQNGAGEAPS